MPSPVSDTRQQEVPTHRLTISPTHLLYTSHTHIPHILTYSYTHILTYSQSHNLTILQFHNLTISPTHLLTYSPTHILTYSHNPSNHRSLPTGSARPQDGEVFGEFPPRKELSKYTKFPMVIPSPPAAYNSHYNHTHLRALADGADSVLPAMFHGVGAVERKGYLVALLDYLQDAATGPKEGWRNG